ncbi:hypothetical protein EP7_002519 [Isosphaeraceae bacterium EP7]
MTFPLAGLRFVLVSLPACALFALAGGCGEAPKEPVAVPPVVTKSDTPFNFENPYNKPSKSPAKGKK